MVLYCEAKDILISEMLAEKRSLDGMEVLNNAKSKRSFSTPRESLDLSNCKKQ
jgi:hypothetical protein